MYSQTVPMLLNYHTW